MKNWVSFLLFLLFSGSTILAEHPSKIKDLELPEITSHNVVIRHVGYSLSYNEQHEQANWVAYELTDQETRKIVKRTNKFIVDHTIRTGSATNEDYKGSGYDRGHLAPAADMGWSEQAMKESFFFSNMSPQVPEFNRGIWKRLEEQVRQWAVDNQTVYVVTGPVLANDLPAIGPDHVSVPRCYYKVILDYTKPDLKGIGFLVPNTSSTLPLRAYAVSIDSVERVTGIDFFPALPDEQERMIEKNVCTDCWSWNLTSTDTTHAVKEVATVRCSAKTKAGKRCKRMTSNASRRCNQHEK